MRRVYPSSEIIRLHNPPAQGLQRETWRENTTTSVRENRRRVSAGGSNHRHVHSVLAFHDHSRFKIQVGKVHLYKQYPERRALDSAYAAVMGYAIEVTA